MAVTVDCDLQHLFGPVRDQEARPTCMAFAASDTHASGRPGWEPLSCEYAYYYALQHDGGAPGDGTTLPGMLAAVAQEGQPQEQGWPYLSVLPNDLTQWKPPANVGQLFRRASEEQQSTALYTLLDGGSPVIVVLAISNAFYRPDAEGVVTGNEPISRARCHAVIAVGHGWRDSERLIFVRNSWGDLWGLGGYAWLTEQHLIPRVIALAIMKEMI